MKLVIAAWLVAGLLLTSAVYGTSGRYGQPCMSTHDCENSLGLICNKNYFGGCTKGICFCGAGMTWDESVRKCKTVRRPHEACDRDSDLCTGKSMCLNGVCRCPEGLSTSQDPKKCLPSLHTKIIGKTCNRDTDVCFHNNDGTYMPGLAECIQGKCQCKSGYSQEGMTCRPKRVGEVGCREHTCVLGAFCQRGSQMCKCPAGKKAARDGDKCVPAGAMYNLAQGEVCDDYAYHAGTRVCGQMLSCSQCPGDSAYTCIRFGKKGVPSTEGGSSSSSEVTSSTVRVTSADLSLYVLLSIIIHINKRITT